MNISRVEIANFRALESISIPLKSFNVVVGENDVGKTSLLNGLDLFFIGKKLSDEKDWFRKDTSKAIRVVLTFVATDDEELQAFKRKNGTIVISKVFEFNGTPVVKAILDDEAAVDVPKPILTKWFSSKRFHFIPVRRDLSVQFSMNKTALLGKLLRAKMQEEMDDTETHDSISVIQERLTQAINGPRSRLQELLQEQMDNNAIKLGFDDLVIDPVEGVKFAVTISDDRIDRVGIENRGAGTQNNLIIALFRLIAELDQSGYLILAMEEPENSLHPKAQRQLMSIIRQIGLKSQVIVTTHSPVFIDRSRYEHNIIMTRTVKGNTIAKTFDESELEQVRTDLGIRVSDALLKGGGNCALLVEGRSEEEGFPTFMAMCGMSEFRMGITIINMNGSNLDKARSITRLLNAYDIPCVIVLDKDAENTADSLKRLQKTELPNLRQVFCLSRGVIEDYYPLEIVASVINQELSPNNIITSDMFDGKKSGDARLKDFGKVMFENNCGQSVGFLKTLLGGVGAQMMQLQDVELDNELVNIFKTVKTISEED